jgi:hypothetical protein
MAIQTAAPGITKRVNCWRRRLKRNVSSSTMRRGIGEVVWALMTVVCARWERVFSGYGMRTTEAEVVRN